MCKKLVLKCRQSKKKRVLIGDLDLGRCRRHWNKNIRSATSARQQNTFHLRDRQRVQARLHAVRF
jgi:hypothetical protein